MSQHTDTDERSTWIDIGTWTKCSSTTARFSTHKRKRFGKWMKAGSVKDLDLSSPTLILNQRRMHWRFSHRTTRIREVGTSESLILTKCRSKGLCCLSDHCRWSSRWNWHNPTTFSRWRKYHCIGIVEEKTNSTNRVHPSQTQQVLHRTSRNCFPWWVVLTSAKDIAKNTITSLLEEWGLVRVVDTTKIESLKLLNQPRFYHFVKNPTGCCVPSTTSGRSKKVRYENWLRRSPWCGSVLILLQKPQAMEEMFEELHPLLLGLEIPPSGGGPTISTIADVQNHIHCMRNWARRRVPLWSANLRLRAVIDVEPDAVYLGISETKTTKASEQRLYIEDVLQRTQSCGLVQAVVLGQKVASTLHLEFNTLISHAKSCRRTSSPHSSSASSDERDEQQGRTDEATPKYREEVDHSHNEAIDKESLLCGNWWWFARQHSIWYTRKALVCKVQRVSLGHFLRTLDLLATHRTLERIQWVWRSDQEQRSGVHRAIWWDAWWDSWQRVWQGEIWGSRYWLQATSKRFP